MIRNRYRYKKEQPIQNGLPSKTVPNETMSIRELMERFTTAGMPATVKEEQYSENPSLDDYDLEKVKNLDLAEIDEVRNQIGEQIREQQEALDKQKKQADEEVINQAIAKHSESLKVQTEENPQPPK